MAGFLGMFNFDKPGRGVYKDDPQKRGFFLFFDIYFRKFWRIVSLSLSYTLGCIPAFIVFFFLNTYVQALFSPITDPAFITYMGIYITLFLLCFWGAGPVSAGHAYVLRNFTREDHAWVWDDFWTQVGKNFWQGCGVFVLDIVLFAVLPSAACLYILHGSAMPLPPVLSMALGFLAILFFVIYTMMHFFIYPLMVTLDMKFGRLLKTALQLTIANLPGCIAIFITSGILFGLFLALYFLHVAFVVLFAALGFSTVVFAQVFYATDKIDTVLSQIHGE